MLRITHPLFAIILIANSISCCSTQSVCTTKACAREAEEMLRKIDDSVGICDNFYDFACGNYKPDLPSHKVKIDSLSLIQDTLQERLNTLMGAEVITSDIEPFKQLKVFYKNCMNKEMIQSVGLKSIEESLNLIGGWPVTLSTWNESTWSWQKMALDLELLGFSANFLFEPSIMPDQKNTSQRVIGIDQPSLGISREYMIKGINDSIVQAYQSFQIDTAIIYGAEKEVAEKEMKEALDFEITLAKLSLAREDRRNATKLYNPVLLSELQEKFPVLEWAEYFNTLIDIKPEIRQNELIIISNETFFEELFQLLNSTPKRTVANYMMWRATSSVSSFLDDKVRNRVLGFLKIQSGTQEYEPRWKECVGMTAKYLPVATGALYVRKYFSEGAKDAATEMVKTISSEFKGILEDVSWMDENTKASALEKLRKIENHIGYPSELMDDQKLIEFHENAQVIEDDYLRSALNLNYFRLTSESKKLREAVNKTDWETHSDVAIANAYYSWFQNSILIPAGILQGQFFSADRPRYMNYAGIGLVIGHEITHGFDDQGRQFDSDGNLFNWWKETTKTAYLEKARCIIEQYGNFTETNVDLKLNGINTQGENIADHGGVLTAYRAYQKWVKENHPEGTLPGLNFTTNQLFWISLTQTWCSVYRPEALKLAITTGTHSIARFRIIGPLSNTKEFSSDFQCPSGSPMNPEVKCKVW